MHGSVAAATREEEKNEQAWKEHLLGIPPDASRRLLSYDSPSCHRGRPRNPSSVPPEDATFVEGTSDHKSHPRGLRLVPQGFSALLILTLCDPGSSYDQLLSNEQLPAFQQGDAVVRSVLGRHEIRVALAKDTRQESDYRPTRDIKIFTAPTLVLRGTAEEIGLDNRTLTSFLETHFLQEFAFLQTAFAFDKTYETWEIGLFECEVWTVGKNYPIAFHVQCAAGSMDAPRHWQFATLGYGPKDKIITMVRETLESIVIEYGTFVRKARDKSES